MKTIYIYDNNKNNITNDKYMYDDYDKFGFQIFNLIYAIYLYNLYNSNNNKCKIIYIYDNLKNIPTINKIYNDIKQKVSFILYEDFHNNNHSNIIDEIININDITTIVSLNDLPNYNFLANHTQFNSLVNLTYKMYKTFNNDDKNIFLNLNEKLITDERLFKLKDYSYTAISIVFGNKLSYTNKNENDEIILNSPLYYLKNMLKYGNIHVIITDSENIVKNFITSKIKKKYNIIIINNNPIHNLYLFLNANDIFLECSPLCFAGAYFNSKSICHLNLINRKNNIFFKPIENTISDNWNLSYDKNNILNFDSYTIKLLLKIKNNVELKNNENNLELLHNLNLSNIKNKLNTTPDDFIFKLLEKNNVYNNVRVKYQIRSNINKLEMEIYFENILNKNNVSTCLYLTDNIFSNTIERLQSFDNTKVYINYLNDEDIYILYKNNIINDQAYINLLYDLNRIYSKVNLHSIDSLILFPIKSDYSIEYDFIYDFYIFYVNKILNIVKNLKLLVIVYSPNLILPFTINTLINLANHSSHYEINNILKDYIIIIFHNIKNYNINTNKLENKFYKFYSNICSLTNDDIIIEIANAQYKKKSYATSFLINLKNNYKYNKNMEYKINIINFPIKVYNNIFTNKLLNYIYDLYDFKNEKIKLFTYDNLKNENSKLINYFVIPEKSNKKSLAKPLAKSFTKPLAKSLTKPLEKSNKKTLKNKKKTK